MTIHLPVITTLARYEGPDFEEFCIDKGQYLSAKRDRNSCLPCPLHELCQVGFDEQLERVRRGENPSLTEGREFSEDALSRDNLLKGLTEAQAEFVANRIPGF